MCLKWILSLLLCASCGASSPDVDDTAWTAAATATLESCPEKRLTGEIMVRQESELAALIGVTHVDFLSIGVPVTSIEALSCLEYAGRFLGIGHPEQAFESLEPLRRLRRVDGQLLLESSAVTDLTPLRRLEHVGGRLSLKLPNAASWDGLQGLTSGHLVLVGGKMTDLRGLTRLETGKLHLLGQRELTSLRGLDALVSLDSLKIHAADALTTLSQLPPVVVEALYVNDNPSLETLQGLEHVKRARIVQITGNNRITSLQGLDGLEEIYRRPNRFSNLVVNDNGNLRSLSGLGAVRTIDGTLQIKSNFLEPTEIGGEEESHLTSLIGLESLETVTGTLEVTANPALTSISPLRPDRGGSLRNVGYLKFWTNRLLPTCNAQGLADTLQGAGQVGIWDNLPDDCGS